MGTKCMHHLGVDAFTSCSSSSLGILALTPILEAESRFQPTAEEVLLDTIWMGDGDPSRPAQAS